MSNNGKTVIYSHKLWIVTITACIILGMMFPMGEPPTLATNTKIAHATLPSLSYSVYTLTDRTFNIQGWNGLGCGNDYESWNYKLVSVNLPYNTPALEDRTFDVIEEKMEGCGNDEDNNNGSYEDVLKKRKKK